MWCPPGIPLRKTRPRRLPSAPRIRFGRGRINIVGVKAYLVVDLALLRIAQYVVRLRKRLELLFRRLVARIYIRMVFARQLAKRLADLVRRGEILNAQRRVIIFGLGGHGFLSMSS